MSEEIFNKVLSLRILPHGLIYMTVKVVLPLVICLCQYLDVYNGKDKVVIFIMCNCVLIILIDLLNKVFNDSTICYELKVNTKTTCVSCWRSLSLDYHNGEVKTISTNKTIPLSIGLGEPKPHDTSVMLYITRPSFHWLLLLMNYFTYLLGITKKNYTILSHNSVHRKFNYNYHHV